MTMQQTVLLSNNHPTSLSAQAASVTYCMSAQTVVEQAGGCQPTLQVPHLDGVVHASRQQLVAITGMEVLQATQTVLA